MRGREKQQGVVGDMREKYQVIVECTKKQKKRNKRNLRRLRIRYSYKSDGIYYFMGKVHERASEEVQEYCRANRLKYYIDNEFGIRSSNYRNTFFRTYKPILKRFYFCSYCGVLLTPRKVSVDHLYPIGSARCSIELQKKLLKKGIKNINDAKNLVPACERCNKQKGKKMGDWIRKGEIGRHQKLWLIRHIVRILLLFCVIVLIVYLTSGMPNVVGRLEELWENFIRFLQSK